jgi:hypothetical protein
MWIRAEGVFEPIIDSDYFYIVQNIIAQRSRKLTDETLLSKLSDLHQRKGWLSGILIDETNDMPSSSAYRSRFGSLIQAYTMIGYTPDRDYRYIEINRRLREMHPGIVDSTMEKIIQLGGTVYRDDVTELVIVNNEISVSIVICRCCQTPVGNNRWKVRLDSRLRPDITIAIRMDAANRDILDYYLLPSLDIESSRLKLKEANGFGLDTYRFDNLDGFFKLAYRTQLQEVA